MLPLAMGRDPDELERTCRERDLYRAILELDACDDLSALLAHALSLVVSVSEAEQGYLELYGVGSGEAGPAGEGPARPGSLSLAHGFSTEAVELVRRSLSTGIVGEALATGRTIATASAVDDPRFAAFESVQTGRIRAVLCSPIQLVGPRGASLSAGGDARVTTLRLDRLRGRR